MKNYNLTDNDAKQLCKLYPKIKIPFLDKRDYYLWTQRHTLPIDSLVNQLEICKLNNGEIERYKYKKSEEIIDYFKSCLLPIFNSLELKPFKSDYPKEFNNWDSKKIYQSIDIKEANFSIFKYKTAFCSKYKLWSEFCIEKFDLDPFIANSKMFRQIIFGNLNPSRQAHFQKEYMLSLAELLKHTNKIIKISDDEIILEFDSLKDYEQRDVYTENFISKLDITLKFKAFVTERIENYGDHLLIKKPLDCKSTFDWDITIPGHRYFIHYKTLILQFSLEDNDLLFEPEPKRLAKWII